MYQSPTRPFPSPTEGVCTAATVRDTADTGAPWWRVVVVIKQTKTLWETTRMSTETRW